jgi:hypothetical protein
MVSAVAAFTFPWLRGFVLVGALSAACSGRPLPVPGAPLTPPTALCVTEPAQGGCRPASEVDTWLHSPDLEIVSAAETPAGRQGARVLTLALPNAAGRTIFRAKWRSYATTSNMNDPRKELAAYALERKLLRPEQLVIPPAAGHCFALDHYRRRVEPNAKPTFARIPCVYGILSYWLEGARGIDDAEDEDWIESDELLNWRLFRGDPSYRRSLADVNLLAHLISHGDSHRKQFLFTRHFGALRVYLVDNSLAFSAFRNPSVEHDQDWSNILVPSLSAESIERLRGLTRAALAELLVAEQYQVSAGRLLNVAPDAPGGRTDRGLRWAGDKLQVGLTQAEAEVVWNRVQALLKRVDRAQIRTF